MTAEVPKAAGSPAQTPEEPVTRRGGVVERCEDKRAEDAPWEPKLVTVLAIDVSWPQASGRDAPCEVLWTTVGRWQ